MAELNFQVVDVAQIPKTAHARIGGIIDATTAERFSVTLRTLIDDMGFIRLILDFTDISFVNSSGFSKLAALSDYVNYKKGMILVCNIKDDIRLLLDELGLTSFYTIAENVEAAKQFIKDSLSSDELTTTGKKTSVLARKSIITTAIPINGQNAIPISKSQESSDKQGEEVGYFNNYEDFHSSPDNHFSNNSGTDKEEAERPLPIDSADSDFETDFPQIDTSASRTRIADSPDMVAHSQLEALEKSQMSVPSAKLALTNYINDIPEKYRLWCKISVSLSTGSTGTLNLVVVVKKSIENDPESFVIHAKNSFITLIPSIVGGRCKPSAMAINAGQSDAEFNFRIAPGGAQNGKGQKRSRIEIWYGNRALKSVHSPNPW